MADRRGVENEKEDMASDGLETLRIFSATRNGTSSRLVQTATCSKFEET